MSPKQSWEQEETPLLGRLAEFRTALQDEIEAARRSESSLAVPLINGRRIAQIGGGYQYAFEVENLLNLPGDAPGDLYVQGYPPQEVCVVSVDGMTITLSIPRDLGGVVPSARLQSNLAHLMRKLIERIEGMASRSNPVGDRILGDLPIAGTPVHVDANDLTPSQLSALACSLGRNATFIWGPPGTGKTRTIGAIGENLYRQQRSALLVSHTNAAVDEAILRIAETMEPRKLAEGKALRVGDPRDTRFGDERYRELLLKTHTDRRSAELAEQRDAREEQKSTAIKEVLRISRLIDVVEWTMEAERDIASMSQELREILASETAVEQAQEKQKALLCQSAAWSSAAKAARHAKATISRMTQLDGEIREAVQILNALETDIGNAKSRLGSGETVLELTISVGWLTRRWRGLPAPDKQREEVKRLRDELVSLQGRHALAAEVLAALEQKRAGLFSEIEAFKNTYSASPDEVLAKAAEHPARLESIKLEVDRLRREAAGRRHSLESLLARRLAVLRDWGFTEVDATDAPGMLDAVQAAHHVAKCQAAGQDLRCLRTRRDDLNNSIRAQEAELQDIEESLKKVEELVIAEATVVATTLTRAYLRDSIQSRRFDTVILDEASMAPIPAIWVAASTATDNAVVVGDFKQLPPIVISEKDLAVKWLGRDVFEVAGLDGIQDSTGRRVDLLEQRRMHPEISSIPSKLVYGGRLQDGQAMEREGEDRLAAWYKPDWGHDHPVLLVDTGSVGAWVTSVSRGARASRLNFLSATICVNLAGRLLREDRQQLPDGERPRVLIACPYSPHAQLLRRLLHDEGISRDVRAGTVHSFQGSEADVVILDLVNDEPHWRVALFMPNRDRATRRLLNVAVSRARRRLMIVGDFEYIQKQAKRAFLGKHLIPFLLTNYHRVDAKDVVPLGLAARAARAQVKLIGGAVEAMADRLVVTQEVFYPMLRDDLAKSRQRIVIYSPFLTWERLGELTADLRSAAERGVRVYVVTKACGDRSRRELGGYRSLEKTLANWGITVVHKRRMHEKLVLIDDDITWVGSLNPLSFSNTQEIMERRRSRDVASDYARALLLDELLAAYEEGQPMCPICGNEVVASEGADDPFYWTCVEEDCYSRSVDEPPLRRGVIVCANCGGSVEFGEWGGKPVWRCKDNPRHRQRIARTHLRLPKMRELIPRQQLRSLARTLGATNLKGRNARGRIKQSSLFDLTE